MAVSTLPIPPECFDWIIHNLSFDDVLSIKAVSKSIYTDIEMPSLNNNAKFGFLRYFISINNIDMVEYICSLSETPIRSEILYSDSILYDYVLDDDLDLLINAATSQYYDCVLHLLRCGYRESLGNNNWIKHKMNIFNEMIYSYVISKIDANNIEKEDLIDWYRYGLIYYQDFSDGIIFLHTFCDKLTYTGELLMLDALLPYCKLNDFQVKENLYGKDCFDFIRRGNGKYQQQVYDRIVSYYTT